MSILSENQITGIKAAIKLATDQFFVTGITLHKLVGTLDRFNEDNGANEYEDVELSGMVEYYNFANDRLVLMPEGAMDNGSLKLTFNTQDLVTAGVVDDTAGDTRLLVKPETDYCTVRGERMRVVYAGFDGPLDDLPALVIVIVRKMIDAT